MAKDEDSKRVKREQQRSAYVLKREANEKLNSFQKYIGVSLLASAALGIYLLVTDKSLWLLAVSHAYGLIVICTIDIILGAANLLAFSRKTIPLSYGWALLTILLQLGDIVTAPQYKMTMQYFARYLFGLWSFDAILAVQVIILALGLSARSYQKVLVKKKQLTYFDMGFKKGRRDFIQIAGAIGGLIAIAGILGALETFSSPQNSTNNGSTQTSNLPSGAIANKNDLQTGVPVYFDFPSSGYPNMLLKRSDGSLLAVSMLCTHVCCQCQYNSASTDIFCPCHGSIFSQGGTRLSGPASGNLPTIQLSVDNNGNIFPVKVVGSGPCVSGN